MKKLVVLFPGIGYHCDKPLLYYGLKLIMIFQSWQWDKKLCRLMKNDGIMEVTEI